MGRIIIPKVKLRHYYISRGYTIQEICDRYSVCYPVVSRLLKEYGIKTRTGLSAQRMKPIPQKILIQLYKYEGISIDEIARRYGRSDIYVSTKLKRIGITIKDKTRKIQGYFKGKTLSIEARKNISEKRLDAYANGTLIHWNTGNKTPLSTCKKISETLKSTLKSVAPS